MKSFRAVCFLNAFLVLPFAVSALSVPDFTFGLFDIDLGPEGAGVARGYGATALGWGIVCLLLRNRMELQVVTAVLIASLAFNGAEVLLQVPLALSGTVSAMIWVTIPGHGLIAVLSALGITQTRADQTQAGQ